ncbi:hypothetical protein BV25DRAFT_1918739 [Artomyces pyxidatus]|uniref:Uncharacterized protein n=1 Tax=Artomyces pyxidatus TaxID=48021 RepID=A0ACB8STA8_9AGAM|nr:hypothetical protein BV25DRAFT_1918739 [Artomyces pyxidatus]
MARRARSDVSSSSSGDESSSDSTPNTSPPPSLKRGKKRVKHGKSRAKKNPYICAARGIPRTIELFIGVKDAFRVALHMKKGTGQRSNTGSDEIEDELSHIPASERGYYKIVYDKIVDLVPGFQAKIAAEAGTENFDTLISNMQAAANNARSVDTSLLKKSVQELIALPESLGPCKIQPTLKKSERGGNHPQLARLICPIKDLADFDQDPIVGRKKLIMPNNGYKVTATRWPTMLYKDYQLVDRNNLLEGLFRSDFVVNCWMAIFLGASAINIEPGTATIKKGCNADIHGILRVGIHDLAYSIVQGRFSIGTLESWTEKEDNFNYSDFYHAILDTLDPEDPWCEELLSWLNKRVFGHENGALGGTELEVEGDSDWEDFKAARAQRKADAKAARGTTTAAQAPLTVTRSTLDMAVFTAPPDARPAEQANAPESAQHANAPQPAQLPEPSESAQHPEASESAQHPDVSELGLELTISDTGRIQEPAPTPTTPTRSSHNPAPPSQVESPLTPANASSPPPRPPKPRPTMITLSTRTANAASASDAGTATKATKKRKQADIDESDFSSDDDSDGQKKKKKKKKKTKAKTKGKGKGKQKEPDTDDETSKSKKSKKSKGTRKR